MTKKKLKCFDDASGSFASITCSLISIKFKYLVCWWSNYANLWKIHSGDNIWLEMHTSLLFCAHLKNINQEVNFLNYKDSMTYRSFTAFYFLCIFADLKLRLNFVSAVKERKTRLFRIIFCDSSCSLISPWTWNFYEPYVLNKLFVISFS